MRRYFELFGGDFQDYEDYIKVMEQEMWGEDVTLGFTLAYDFTLCTKLWNAMYINIPGGFYGIDIDDEGYFVVAGYDNSNNEYILKHNNNGAIPSIWKFDVTQTGPIIPGSIHFTNNGS